MCLPSVLHLGSRFWGSLPSGLPHGLYSHTVCKRRGEPLARKPWGLLPSKDWPVILALLASSLIGPPCGEPLGLNGPLLDGCVMPGMRGPIWSICCLPGLNETPAAAEAQGVFLGALSKQALNFAKQPPKSNQLCTGGILDRGLSQRKPEGTERREQKEI